MLDCVDEISDGRFIVGVARSDGMQLINTHDRMVYGVEIFPFMFGNNVKFDAQKSVKLPSTIKFMFWNNYNIYCNVRKGDVVQAYGVHRHIPYRWQGGDNQVHEEVIIVAHSMLILHCEKYSSCKDEIDHPFF